MEAQPRARSSELTVEALGDELLVFDTARNRAHSLNATAAQVWRACDGNRTVAQLAVVCDLDPDTVELALERLEGCRLLETTRPRLDTGAPKVNRRAVLRKAALTGAGIGIALPVIRSITAPTPAHAGSLICVGEPCLDSTTCCPNYTCFAGGQCQPGSCYSASSSCTNTASCCNGLVCSSSSSGSSYCVPAA
jgi:hypothetical protein